MSQSANQTGIFARRKAFQKQCRDIALKHWVASSGDADAAKAAANDECRSVIGMILIGVAIRLIAAYIIGWFNAKNLNPSPEWTAGEPELSDESFEQDVASTLNWENES